MRTVFRASAMQHRIPNVIYSESPMPRWKQFALRAGTVVLSIVMPFVFFLLDEAFGKVNVIIAAALFFIVAIFVAIWWERRRRRLRRRPTVAERVG